MSWRHRASSAGAVRRHSGGSALTGGTPSGDHLVQDKVAQLQQLLISCRAENQKIKQQLSCLSSLVKRAWLGDRTALVHVANIVGVAPPEIKRSQDDTDNLVISIEPKPSVINNWAKLTVGLLNRQYCHLEREVEEEQRRHLMNRNAYLEEQVERNYVRPAGPDRWEIVQRPGVVPTEEGPARKPLRENGKKKPTSKHLYRPANQRSEHGTDPRLTWGDLIPDQNAKDGYDRDCLLNKLSNGSRYPGSSDHNQRSRLDYADPQRYTAAGLYEDTSAINTDTQRRRPPSGREQRMADATRSRPKSSILPKGERPMKYETTRPLSTKGRTNPTETHNGSHSNRPPSGKKWMKTHTFITNQNEDENQMHLDLNDLDLNDERDHRDNPEDSWDSQEEEREKRRQATEAILVKIKKPESVLQYERDLASLGVLQDDFKSRTLSLQKKLGIPTEGMVQH